MTSRCGGSRAIRFAAVAAVTALMAGACSSDDGSPAAASATTSTTAVTTTTAASPTTSTTSSSTTTSTTEPEVIPGLQRGARGPHVEELQRRLASLTYDVGPVDGKYGNLTAQAVMAFQKVNRLDRTGNVDDQTGALLASASAPSPRMPHAEATRLEFDRNRQVLFVVVDDVLRATLNASSGNNVPFCENGYCGNASTPTGSFRVTRRIDGWRHGPLGSLYNPLYFNGGIAVHGASHVPAYPASHGCVRINMSAAEWLPALIPNGTPVYVYADSLPTPFSSRTTSTSTTTSTTTAPTTTTTTATTTSSSTTTTSSSTTTTTAAPTTTTTTP